MPIYAKGFGDFPLTFRTDAALEALALGSPGMGAFGRRFPRGLERLENSPAQLALGDPAQCAAA
jgi:hypothetical protein